MRKSEVVLEFVLVGIPVVMALGTVILQEGLASLLGLGPGYVLTYLSWFPLIIVLGGPLFEELGWRGFALLRLQPLCLQPLYIWSFGGDSHPGATVGPLAPAPVSGSLLGEASGGRGFLAIVKFVLIAIAFAIITT